MWIRTCDLTYEAIALTQSHDTPTYVFYYNKRYRLDPLENK